MSVGDGWVRFRHFGEEAYAGTERAIQQLVGVDEELVRVDPDGLAAAANWDALRSPETYIGYGRSARRIDTKPTELALNQWAFTGSWTIDEESAVLDGGAGSRTASTAVTLTSSWPRQESHRSRPSRSFSMVSRRA